MLQRTPAIFYYISIKVFCKDSHHTFTEVTSLDHKIFHNPVKQTTFVMQWLLGGFSCTLFT